MFGRRAVFGRHGRSRGEPAPILRASVDDDGVARVFPRALWDDPRIGGFLRDMGLDPDDPQNLLPGPHDFYRSRFAEGRNGLEARIEALRAAHPEAPDCDIQPLLLIDLPVWRGRFGHLLVEQMGLIAWDEWNVLLLAGDEATAGACGLPLHPGAIPALNVRVIEALHDLGTRTTAEMAHACPEGCPPSGPGRATCLAIEAAARDELLGFIAICRDQVEALLAEVPA